VPIWTVIDATSQRHDDALHSATSAARRPLLGSPAAPRAGATTTVAFAEGLAAGNGAASVVWMVEHQVGREAGYWVTV
jgi:hypothetical protein